MGNSTPNEGNKTHFPQVQLVMINNIYIINFYQPFLTKYFTGFPPMIWLYIVICGR